MTDMDESQIPEFKEKTELKKSSIFGYKNKRHILTIYAFFGFFFAYALRVNLSVAIVDMVHSPVPSLKPVSSASNSTSTSQPPVKYEWSSVLQGYILASFFYGYIVTQLPAAFLTTKYGGKIFFGGGIGICSLLSLMTPLATYIGPISLILLRTLQGLFQGFIYTSMHALWSKWAPPSERSSLATFAFSGSYIGSVAALSIGGIIGEYINWQSIFYVSGSAGLIWTVCWFYFISESPAVHETILPEERAYIEESYIQNDNYLDIPWQSILQSKAVWAIVIIHSAENWGIYTMLTEMPTFLSEVMGFNMDKAGIISALPYLIMALVLYLIGYISDLMSKQKMTYTFIRKIFSCTGLVAQSFFMVLMILSKDPIEIVICLMLAIGFGGMTWASFGVNHLDIGAGYANVLMAISNTFATIPGIISPILTGHIVQNKTKSEWNTVFWITTVIYTLGAIVYGFIGSGETEPWAYTSSANLALASNTESTDETSYVFKNNEVNPLKKSAEGNVNTTYDTIEK